MSVEMSRAFSIVMPCMKFQRKDREVWAVTAVMDGLPHVKVCCIGFSCLRSSGLWLFQHLRDGELAKIRERMYPALSEE